MKQYWTLLHGRTSSVSIRLSVLSESLAKTVVNANKMLYFYVSLPADSCNYCMTSFMSVLPFYLLHVISEFKERVLIKFGTSRINQIMSEILDFGSARDYTNSTHQTQLIKFMDQTPKTAFRLLSVTSTLILSPHLCLGFLSSLFPSSFPTRPLMQRCSSTHRTTSSRGISFTPRSLYPREKCSGTN
jgi:hypothetical protein